MLPGITPALSGGSTWGNDAYTKLLMHFDGVAGSTIFPDSSPAQHGNAAVGGVAKVATPGLFGNGALLISGGNGNIGYVNSPDWEFGAGDFTIDYWDYRVDTTARPILVRDSSTNAYQAFLVGWDIGGGNTGVFASNDGATFNVVSALSLGPYNVSAWTHRALVRKGNTFYGFCNGVLQGTQTSSLPLVASSGALSIGYWGYSTTFFYQGYIEELRISKGIARWTANFTPPIAPYGPTVPPPTQAAATNFLVTAPTNPGSGTFSFTVQARDASNNNTTNYSGTVHFTYTGATSVVPADSTLTSGFGTFTGQVGSGAHTITATDTVNSSITGTSGNVQGGP